MPGSIISFTRNLFCCISQEKKDNKRQECEDNEHNEEEVGLNVAYRQAGKRENSKVKGTLVHLIVSIVAVLTSLGALISVSVMYANQRSNSRRQPVLAQAKPETYPVCIDCLKLVKSPYKPSESDVVLEKFTKKEINDVVKCCAENATQLSTMFEAIARDKETLTDLIQESSKLGIPAGTDMQYTSVSAHKQMTSEYTGRKFNTLGQNYVRFNASHNDLLTEHVRGVTVLEDGLVIQHTGYYFTYGSVQYRYDNQNIGENKTWTSSIYRIRPDSVHSGVLLTSVHTSCGSCNQITETAFTGGVFLLKAGDFVQVFLSEKGMVDFNKESTYFGLVMLGQKTT